MLSHAATQAWHALASRVADTLEHLQQMGREIPAIPDERARINDDGTLTVFVDIPGVLNVSLQVPAEQWTYGQ